MPMPGMNDEHRVRIVVWTRALHRAICALQVCTNDGKHTWHIFFGDAPCQALVLGG